ncbi:DUF664 domain-containing protein [Rhodococcus sp. BL-253-APC-6A1W]|nr:DUF664 domain-containing protein [Rhodococcus sp. BL-253-APC-6A1W]NME81013.1 DUF664 domain-containing protein [Rhodococcus sp. 105337]
MHLLGETSCHLGHLNIAREVIDGATWDLEIGTDDLDTSAVDEMALVSARVTGHRESNP